MHNIGMRGGFSDRKGYTGINNVIQIEDLDVRSRTALFNLISQLLHALWSNSNAFVEKYLTNLFCNVFIMDFMSAKSLADYFNDSCEKIKDVFMEEPFFLVFDIIEHFIAYDWTSGASINYTSKPEFFRTISSYATNYFNQLFERECIGYRLIGNQITDIINPEEMKAISEAATSKYSSASEHIRKAIDLLYNRKNPDYANTIKESISSIEAVCQVITGDASATLGQALKTIKINTPVHPALVDAFSKIYGYTSDASGIRHANGMGGPSATFDEAKYMLVSCSAFLNYLIGINK